MKINKQSLSDAIDFPAAIIKNKTTLPIFTTLRLESLKGKLSITACDCDQHCSITTQCDGDLDPCCVPAHSLKTVLNLCAESVEMTIVDGRLKIDSGGTFTLGVLDAKEWPAWETEKAKRVNIPCPELAEAIASVSFAIATPDESRSALQNVHIVSDSKVLTVEATTGRELARVTKPTKEGKFELCIPSEFIGNLCRALNMDKAKASFSETKAVVSFDGGEFSCKLAEAIYPSTNVIIQDKRTLLGEIDPAKWHPVFSSCIALSGIDASLSCRFTVENGRITHDGNGGKIDVACPEKFDGIICSDSKSALACFKAFGSGKTKVSIAESKSIFLERDNLTVCFAQLRK